MATKFYTTLSNIRLRGTHITAMQPVYSLSDHVSKVWWAKAIVRGIDTELIVSGPFDTKQDAMQWITNNFK